MTYRAASDLFNQPPSRRPLATTVVAAALLAVPLLGARQAHAAEPGDAPELAIRCDDIGMGHSVNQAVRQLLATGMPFSASVMVPCPWFLEAAEILRDQPRVSVGIHLTLNSEWRHYRWGPVLGASAVPSLVDENGHFHTSEADFRAAGADLGEVRRELRAQIQRALDAGLEVDYLDYHMLTALSTPELQRIVEELAREFGVGLSRYFGERAASVWDLEPENKLDGLLRIVGQAEPGPPTVAVIHPGLETPEMSALVDLNNPRDPFRVAQHRQSELAALTSPAFRQAITARQVRLVTYRQIIDRLGLAAMRPPARAGYSAIDDEE